MKILSQYDAIIYEIDKGADYTDNTTVEKRKKTKQTKSGGNAMSLRVLKVQMWRKKYNFDIFVELR